MIAQPRRMCFKINSIEPIQKHHRSPHRVSQRSCVCFAAEICRNNPKIFPALFDFSIFSIKFAPLNTYAMEVNALIQEIQRLPLKNKFLVVEETIKSIKKEELGNQMELAASELYNDYVNDKELTSFTSLDFEQFYETK